MCLARAEFFINYSYILAFSSRLEFFMDFQLVVIHYFYHKWFGFTLYPSECFILFFLTLVHWITASTFVPCVGNCYKLPV
jgi:hypothetical protein